MGVQVTKMMSSGSNGSLGSQSWGYLLNIITLAAICCYYHGDHVIVKKGFQPYKRLKRVRLMRLALREFFNAGRQFYFSVLRGYMSASVQRGHLHMR